MNKMKKILQLCSIVFLFSVAICSCKADFDNLVYLTVTFDSNTGTGTMEPQIFEENVPQLLSENKFTKEGYTFGGWATAADASKAEYADKAEFTAKEDITLYAIWNLIPSETPPVPSKYTITYVSAYGTKPANKEVDKGYKLTSSDLPDLGETEDKYFDKWDKTVGTEITADTTITAYWEQIYYLKNFADIISYMEMEKTQVEKSFSLQKHILIFPMIMDVQLMHLLDTSKVLFHLDLTLTKKQLQFTETATEFMHQMIVNSSLTVYQQ